MRLIDADALIERIKDRYCTECDNYNGVRCRACSADDAMSMVDESPTAEAIMLAWLYDRRFRSEYVIGQQDRKLSAAISRVLEEYKNKREVWP